MMQAAVQVFSATTNVNQYALSFIIPLGVSAYAVLGGLKVSIPASLQLLDIWRLQPLYIFLLASSFVST